MLPTGNTLHVSFTLIVYIALISTSRDKTEITPFQQKMNLGKSLLILGLAHHCYVNREFLCVLMAATDNSAMTAHGNEVICPTGLLHRAGETLSGARQACEHHSLCTTGFTTPRSGPSWLPVAQVGIWSHSP